MHHSKLVVSAIVPECRSENEWIQKAQDEEDEPIRHACWYMRKESKEETEGTDHESEEYHVRRFCMMLKRHRRRIFRVYQRNVNRTSHNKSMQSNKRIADTC